jgi:hypothetical protein
MSTSDPLRTLALLLGSVVGRLAACISICQSRCTAGESLPARWVSLCLAYLIALGLEQAAQEIQWSIAMREARANIRTETHFSNYFFAFRAAAEPCLQKRLDSISDVIERVAAHQQVARLGSIGPDIGNGLSDNSWQAERASQTLTHFGNRELNLLGEYYHQLDSVADAVFREDADWSELRVLKGNPSRLGAEDVAGLRRSLQHAHFENYLISMISRGELRDARRLGLTVPTPDKTRLAAVCAPL